LREACLPFINRLLQQLGVRVLVPIHRWRRGFLPEAWNDGRMLRLQAARRLTGQGPAYPLAASRSRSTSRTGGCPNRRLYSRLNCEASS